MVTDMVHDRLYRVCRSKNVSKVFDQLKDIPGAESVEDAVIDLSEGYRKLIKALFPNARITADNFHVLRLLLPAINKTRNKIAGDRRTKLFLNTGWCIDFWSRPQNFKRSISSKKDCTGFTELKAITGLLWHSKIF